MASHKKSTIKERYSLTEIRKAMKALGTKDFKHATAVLVAKEIGYNIRNKKAIKAFCLRMQHANRMEE